MTVEEFDAQGWTGQMKAKYVGIIYDVANVDFEEKTIGLSRNGGLILEIPCGKVTLIKKEEEKHA